MHGSNAPTNEEPTTFHYYSSDWQEAERLSTRLTLALAEVDGAAPDTLDTGLRSAVDLDALDTLFHANSDATGRVILPLRGREAHVFADGSFVFLDRHEARLQ